MEPVQLRFDYGALDTETRDFVLERAERIHNLARMTAAGIVQIGQYLTEVKTRLKHGQFLDWIEREFAWKERMAQTFMRVHESFKSAKFADMQIDVSALYLIAAPSTPEPVRTETVRRAENGEAVSHAGTRALVQHFAETGELPEVTKSLPQMIAERRALLTPQAPSRPKLPAPEESRAEQEKLKAKMKANAEHVKEVFDVIGSIECLSGTPLAAPKIAAEIRRLDTPDKNWRGQLKRARQKLAELATELSS